MEIIRFDRRLGDFERVRWNYTLTGGSFEVEINIPTRSLTTESTTESKNIVIRKNDGGGEKKWSLTTGHVLVRPDR